jgi:hypothetical protein
VASGNTIHSIAGTRLTVIEGQPANSVAAGQVALAAQDAPVGRAVPVVLAA